MEKSEPYGKGPWLITLYSGTETAHIEMDIAENVKVR